MLTEIPTEPSPEEQVEGVIQLIERLTRYGKTADHVTTREFCSGDWSGTLTFESQATPNGLYTEHKLEATDGNGGDFTLEWSGSDEKRLCLQRKSAGVNFMGIPAAINGMLNNREQAEIIALLERVSTLLQRIEEEDQVLIRRAIEEILQEKRAELGDGKDLRIPLFAILLSKKLGLHQ